MLKIPIIGDVLRKVAVARFCRTLGTLISSGVPILEGMDITARTAGNMVIQNAILKSKDAVEQGRNIATPLAETKVFPPMVVQMVGVGEATGALDAMLSKVADFYEDEVDNAVANLTSPHGTDHDRHARRHHRLHRHRHVSAHLQFGQRVREGLIAARSARPLHAFLNSWRSAMTGLLSACPSVPVRADRARGFSLVELLLVLASSAFSVPSPSPATWASGAGPGSSAMPSPTPNPCDVPGESQG